MAENSLPKIHLINNLSGEVVIDSRGRKRPASYIKKRIEVVCRQCQVSFLVRPTESHRMFCGRTCKDLAFRGEGNHKWKSQQYECLECKAAVWRPATRIREGQMIFCSRKCAFQSEARTERIQRSTRPMSHEEWVERCEKRRTLAAAPRRQKQIWECKDCHKKIAYGCTYCPRCKMYHRSPESRKRQGLAISLALKGKMPKNLGQEGKFGNVKRGWFEIEGERFFFRSKWEVNYFLYLRFLLKQNQIQNVEYEKDVFMFDGVRSGTVSYRPDFKVTKNDGSVEYHEVKGWMTPKSKTQLKRMAKYHPTVKLILIEQKQYYEIKNKLGKLLNFFD